MSNKRVEIQKNHKKDGEFEKQIRKLEKELKRLKIENKSLQSALEKTDEYLINMMKDKPLNEVMQDIKENSDAVVREKCPKCGTQEMKKINLGTIKIVTCTRCPYRNRLNEPGSDQT